MPHSSWRFLAAVLLVAGALRLWGAFDLQGMIEDEPIHVPSALRLGTYGTTAHSDWAHPPLSGLLIYGSILILGDQPRGWRATNLLLGSLTVLALYLVGIRLYPGSVAPGLGASLLALEPFHVFHSRTTFMEVPATFFFLCFLWLALEFAERARPTLAWAGLAAGLTMATKDYFLLAIPLVAAYAWRQARRRGEAVTALAPEFAVGLVLVPLATYLLCYLPWFGRGYDLLEFVRMKADGYAIMQSYRSEEFLQRAWVEAGGVPWEWFLKPFLVGTRFPAEPGWSRLLLEVNNLPLRLLSLAALGFGLALAVKQRSEREALVPGLFAACYLPMLLANRPLYSYSALVLLPFALLATGRGVEQIGAGVGRPRLVQGLFLGVVLGWSAYLYPLATARTVPDWLHRPLTPLVQTPGRP